MSIQGNVNQIISLAGLLASQNPAIKSMGEKRAQLDQLNKQEKLLARREALGQGQDPRLTQQIKQEQFDVASKKYELDPSAETYEAKKASALNKQAGEEMVESLNRMEVQKAKGDFDEDPNEPTQEQKDMAQAQQEAGPPTDDGEVEGINFENWETPTKAEQMAQEARNRLVEAQNEKRATLTRKKGLVKQSYGRYGVMAGRSGRVSGNLNKGGNM